MGKRVFRMRLVSLATERPVGVVQALLRVMVRTGLIAAGNVTVPVHTLSWLWPLWDKKRQTWEDKAIDGIVVPADHAQLPPS